jgi:hypothetical protein
MCRELFDEKIKQTLPYDWQLISDEGDVFKTISDKGNPHHWMYLETPSLHASKRLGKKVTIVRCSVFSSKLMFHDYYMVSEFGKADVVRLSKPSEKKEEFTYNQEILIESLMKLDQIRLLILTGAKTFEP